MKSIIRVENVSKRYRVGVRKEDYTTLRDSLTQAARAPLQRLRRRRNQDDQAFWALWDVGFQVQPGEVLGIIGRNGAGKSTLLKVLSRITEPTMGRVELYGRVGSLLEVGTGFHPELTGRENIYMNGAILGMRRRDIARQFDLIVDFADVGRFIDTPVKHYSSGMFMRLAFAVAGHLDPEILIIDEVLAVGDAAFQRKCLGKIGRVAREGRTVLFVSHNMTAVQSLCSRAVWLHEGQIRADGAVAEVVSDYLNTSFSTMAERTWTDPQSAPGDDTVRLKSARVRPEGGTPADPITVTKPFVLEFEYWNLKDQTKLNLSVMLVNEEGTVIFNTGPAREPNWQGHPFPAGLFRSVCRIPGELMNDGPVRVKLYVVKDKSVVLWEDERILSFEVREDVASRDVWFGKWIGAVRPSLDWTTELIKQDTI